MSDVICLTRSRWGDRAAEDHPLMSRFARTRRVFLVEAPVRAAGSRAFLEEQRGPDGLVLCAPHLPSELEPAHAHHAVARLLDELRARHAIATDILWVEEPDALDHAHRLAPQVIVWDRRTTREGHAPARAGARAHARPLSPRPDLVLVSAQAAASQRRGDPSVRVMPPAIDVARLPAPDAPRPADPPDQAPVPGPRIGLAAPLDAPLDVELLRRVAVALPDHFVIALGAPRGIDVRTLPCRPNVHWLGEKGRDERARYVAGWDVALVPQRARRGVPRLALEALALGVPVVASPAAASDARDLDPRLGALFRSAEAHGFANAIELALRAPRAELIASAMRARASVGWDAAFAQLEAWVAEARERAARHRRALVLARSSA